MAEQLDLRVQLGWWRRSTLTTPVHSSDSCSRNSPSRSVLWKRAICCTSLHCTGTTSNLWTSASQSPSGGADSACRHLVQVKERRFQHGAASRWLVVDRYLGRPSVLLLSIFCGLGDSCMGAGSAESSAVWCAILTGQEGGKAGCGCGNQLAKAALVHCWLKSA